MANDRQQDAEKDRNIKGQGNGPALPEDRDHGSDVSHDAPKNGPSGADGINPDEAGPSTAANTSAPGSSNSPEETDDDHSRVPSRSDIDRDQEDASSISSPIIDVKPPILISPPPTLPTSGNRSNYNPNPKGPPTGMPTKTDNSSTINDKVIGDNDTLPKEIKEPNGREKTTKSKSTPEDQFNTVVNTDLNANAYEALATPARDLLSGSGTDKPIRFTWNSLTDSILKTSKRSLLFDKVIGFMDADNSVKPPANIDTGLIGTISELSGKITKLVPGQINKAVGGDTFKADSAAAFECAGYTGTFLVLNNNLKGYQFQSDSLIFFEGFKLEENNPITLG